MADFENPSENLEKEGLALMREKNYKEAIQKFELLAALTGSAYPYWRIALCYVALGSFNKALRATFKHYAKEARESKHESHLIRGYVLFMMGEKQDTIEKAVQYYTKAYKEFSQFTKEDKNSGEAYYWKGLSSLRAGKFENAISDFAKAEEMPNREREAHIYSGNAYEILGSYVSALSEYEKALSLTKNQNVAKQIQKIIRNLEKKVLAIEVFEDKRDVRQKLLDNPAFWIEKPKITKANGKTLYSLPRFVMSLGAIAKVENYYIVLSDIEDSEYEIEIYDMKANLLNKFRAKDKLNMCKISDNILMCLEIKTPFEIGFEGKLKIVKES
jgi:tetratricopeptide (TPR) repeat protein